MTQNGQTLIGQIIIGALEKSPRNFNRILEICHSTFPDELETILVGMENDGIVIRSEDEYKLDPSIPNLWNTIQNDWQENLDRAYKASSDIMTNIHLPHCLDYEWWFTHSGRQDLAYKLINHSLLPVPKCIAFLASPLLGAFISSLVPETEVYILDRSKTTLDTIGKTLDNKNLHLIHYDAENPLPTKLIGIAQMAFFDPPWYVEYYELFMRRCMQLTYGNYATVAMVLFPVLTRPNSLQERRQVIETAMSYDLSLINIEPQVAHYLTPRFESEVLNKKGINVKNWRKGDLALFFSDGSRLPENIATKIERFQWKEALIDKVKIKVKIKDENRNVYIAPEILTVHGSDAILSSVSRRDPFRDEVDLWTSTQRGFKIKGWKVIWKIIEGMQDGVTTTEEMVARVQESYPDVEVPDSVYAEVEKVWNQLKEHISKR
ncbi:MAG: hypothetical protein PHI66_04720 [Candidatus Pacebacteria bacterium]|nr:hypothetical protein [Candidatus Paceibacterota bacterium]